MAQKQVNPLKNKALNDLEAGKFPQALKKAQLGIKKFPGDADYHAIAGFVLTEMKRYKQSIPHFAEAARMSPGDAQFAENLANALMQTGQIPRALSYAEHKLRQFPNNRELLRVIDEIQLKGQNWRMIIDHASQKLQKDPDNADLLSARGRAYGRIGFVEQSTQDIARAYALAPANEDIALQQAIDLHQAGNKDGADAILWGLFEANSKSAPVLYQLSSGADDSRIADLAKAVDAAIATSDHVDQVLEFAKANLTARSAGLDAALPQFARANAAQNKANPYDPATEEKMYQAIRDLFPTDASPASTEVTAGPRPIFVVGQPRSGTTLMEMMLSVAPDIAGCGELRLAADLSRPVLESGSPFDAVAAAEFAQHYRKLMPPLPDGATAFVDKMPHNYQQVGFLLSAFPDARVINMVRDPRDVGLSKWTRRFPAPGMRYACNLAAIAHSANLYRRYMAHWNLMFADRILTVSYEGLVTDPDSHSRTVAEFCGIEWDQRMLHPERNTSPVRTASIDQVRRKISTGSIGRWRDVAGHLRPMLDGLDPALWPEYAFD